MKKLSLIFTTLLFGVTGIQSQTIYNLKFKSPVTNDTTVYDAFFIRYAYGTGIIRLRYTAADTRTTVVNEMDLEEEIRKNSDGTPDTTTLVLRTVRSRMKRGNSRVKIVPFRLWFNRPGTENIFEPRAVSDTLTATMPPEDNFLVKEFKDRENMSRKFVTDFFLEDEDIVKSLFVITTKGLNAAEQYVKLHLIIVANTLDSIVGKNCGISERLINATFTDLVQTLKIQKGYWKTVLGTDFNKRNVQDAIAKLPINITEDIVVFYYAGHGFRKLKGQGDYWDSKFPFLELRGRGETDYMKNSLSLEKEIFDVIKKKGARLNLVIGDCCNSYPGETNADGTPILNTKTVQAKWLEDNMKKLFLNMTKRESYLMSAAEKWEMAVSTPDKGLIFAHFFRTSLEDLLSGLNMTLMKKGVSWDTVIAAAKEQTVFKAAHTYCKLQKSLCKQHPYYEKR